MECSMIMYRVKVRVKVRVRVRVRNLCVKDGV